LFAVEVAGKQARPLAACDCCRIDYGPAVGRESGCRFYPLRMGQRRDSPRAEGEAVQVVIGCGEYDELPVGRDREGDVAMLDLTASARLTPMRGARGSAFRSRRLAVRSVRSTPACAPRRRSDSFPLDRRWRLGNSRPLRLDLPSLMARSGSTQGNPPCHDQDGWTNLLPLKRPTHFVFATREPEGCRELRFIAETVVFPTA
jgi:hypothetical protein